MRLKAILMSMVMLAALSTLPAAPVVHVSTVTHPPDAVSVYDNPVSVNSEYVSVSVHSEYNFEAFGCLKFIHLEKGSEFNNKDVECFAYDSEITVVHNLNAMGIIEKHKYRSCLEANLISLHKDKYATGNNRLYHKNRYN